MNAKSDVKEAPAREDASRLGGELLRKVKNLVAYEALSFAEATSIALRLRLLAHVLATGLEWPSWIPALRAKDICADASARYQPGKVNARLLLVRASDGDGADLPALQVVSDPLFGWGDRSQRWPRHRGCGRRPLDHVTKAKCRRDR